METIPGAGPRHKEYLGYKVFGKPKDQEERTHNQKYLALAKMWGLKGSTICGTKIRVCKTLI